MNGCLLVAYDKYMGGSHVADLSRISHVGFYWEAETVCGRLHWFESVSIDVDGQRTLDRFD